MTPKLLFTAIMLASSWGGAAFAAESSSDAPSQDAATADSQGERMICKNERVTGSALPRRVCMTKSQRDELRQNAQQNIMASQRSTPSRGGS